ncbi:CsgG/HfaB family protein [uncultured Kordia sp.]|uniref:CsgG/HfaB family protein n=1 Tax=uncultured Kordia sp. TaxID=507699 RepID=UPI002638B4EC|nr:CsgG/HfaB family protein [uncultured Kordia sp.]
MKKITLLIFLLAIGYTPVVFSQDTGYDKDMISLANQAVTKIKKENTLVVAVWFFHNTKGKKTDVGDYIGRDFSVHFTNVEKSFEVVDRDHIEQLSAEHQWNEEGFIDPATAKEVNKLVAADAIVTGTVDYTLHHLRIRIKIIDTETGKQIGAAIKTIRLDESLKNILSEEYENRKVKTSKRRRVLEVEDENDPRTTNEDCERLKTGDYCFKNNTKYVYQIQVLNFNGRNTAPRNMTIKPGQNSCLFNIPEKNYSFKANILEGIVSYLQDSGTFSVKKCQSITYVIED